MSFGRMFVLAPLGSGVWLLLCDVPAGVRAGGIALRVDGQPLRGLRRLSLFPADGGGQVLLSLFRLEDTDGALTVHCGAHEHAGAVPGEHRQARPPAQELLAGIKPGQRAAFALKLLDGLASFFPETGSPLLLPLARGLARQLGVLAPSVDKAFALPGGLYVRFRSRRFAGPATAYCVSAAGVTRAPAAPRAQKGTFDLAVETAATEAAETLVLLAAAESLFAIDLDERAVAPAAALPRFLDALGKPEAGAAVAAMAAGLHAKAEASPPLALVLRELGLMFRAPARPRLPEGLPVEVAADLCIPIPGGGVFLKGRVSDPGWIVAGMTLVGVHGERFDVDWRRHGYPASDAPQAPAEGPRAFVGFFPGAGALAPAGQYRLLVRLASGMELELLPDARWRTPTAARDELLRAIPGQHLTDAMLEEVVGPAIAALQAGHLQDERVARTYRIGEPPRAPRWSVVVPLYRNLSFLRAQVSSFALDPDFAGAELVYVLDSPEQDTDVEHLLRGLHLIYALPITVVVHRRNLGYAPAINTGVAHAAAPVLVLLNSDVVPVEPGWLRTLAARLEAEPEIGAVGPKLLFADGSLQHAGLFFDRDQLGRWYNRHYYKGFPRGFPAAGVARRVPGLTGACIMLTRDVLASVGGMAEDYVIGDYEDSDLALRLHSAGRQCWYEPAAELYHLERQSIAIHEGYTRSVACEYNRWLHGRRWHRELQTLGLYGQAV